MKTSTAAAIKTIAAQMNKTGNPENDYTELAQELFEDVADVAHDVAARGANALDFAATTFNQFGFHPRVAANLARAVLIFLDRNNRAAADYVEGVAEALTN